MLSTRSFIQTVTGFFILIHSCVNAQEQFGNAFSNYSPSSAIFHNPANSTDSEVMIDINLGGFGAFLHSD